MTFLVRRRAEWPPRTPPAIMRVVSRPFAPSRLSVTAFAIFVLAAAGGVAVARAGRRAVAAGERRISLFYTAEVHGTLEPCGCTSDPLGDVARYAGSCARRRRNRARSCWSTRAACSFPEGGASARERPANDARAAFLAGELGKLGLAAAGLAETDLAGGAAAVRPAAPRLELRAAR